MIVFKTGRTFLGFRSWGFLILLLSTVLLAQCRKEVAKPDPDFPELPAYTEKGLNSGGCFINDSAWLTLPIKMFSRNRALIVDSYPGGDSIVLRFIGRYKDSSFQNRQPRGLFIVLKGIQISSDSALEKLNARQFLLDGITNYGGFLDGAQQKAGRATGTLQFGKVAAKKIFSGDGSPDNPKHYYYIIAGRFDMTMATDRNYAIKNGRFEVTIHQGYELYIAP